MSKKVDKHDMNLNQNEKRPFFYTRWYKSKKATNASLDKFSSTAKLHINEIAQTNPKSVLDIGCGAGGILLALQSKGVQGIHGIDASIDAINLAKRRFNKFGSMIDVYLFVGDVVDYPIPKEISAVSVHRVICCYEDVDGIIKKATESQPQTILLTYPTDNILWKIFSFVENSVYAVFSIFIPSLKGLKSWVHSNSKIRDKLREGGYELTRLKSSILWQTDRYILKGSS